MARVRVRSWEGGSRRSRPAARASSKAPARLSRPRAREEPPEPGRRYIQEEIIQARKHRLIKMCSSVAAKLWFLTDRRIREDYPQKEILRALKAKCCEEELDFRAVVMDEVVLTIEQGNLGLRINGELITAYPQVVVVRVPTPWVQSDSDITVLRHLEKMGCRLMNRPQAI
ncbi:RIMKLB isoform 5, partial [Pan troglodytes]